MSLQEAGFEVLLVQGTQTKNLKGKTDVKDAQWIQKLHTFRDSVPRFFRFY